MTLPVTDQTPEDAGAGTATLRAAHRHDRTTPAPDRDAFKRLTEAEARRALYIDFEGQAGQPPVLLGAHRRRRNGRDPFVFQVILDPLFESAGPELRPLSAAVEAIVQRAERRDRRIVAWSEHELEVVRGLADLDPDLVARFERRYANALAVARRWAARLHPDRRPAFGRLSDYTPLVGYVAPDGARPGQVGETIRAVRQTLSKGRPMTPLQRERWRQLLDHNRHDCAGMRAVCLMAARELEVASRPRRGTKRRSKRH